MTLTVRFQCDRCERIKDTSYTNAQQLAGGYNLELAGLKYYLCGDCETGLLEWLNNYNPEEIRYRLCNDESDHDAHFMFYDRDNKRVECKGVISVQPNDAISG